MEYLTIFVCAFIGWYGVDAVINKRILFGRTAIPYTGSSAIFKGVLALILSLLLLTSTLEKFVNSQTQLSSLIVFAFGIISSILVSKWLYNPNTHGKPSGVFKSLKRIFLVLFIVFIVLAVLLIPFGDEKKNLFSLIFP